MRQPADRRAGRGLRGVGCGSAKLAGEAVSHQTERRCELGGEDLVIPLNSSSNLVSLSTGDFI